jgi:hypothetical protein
MRFRIINAFTKKGKSKNSFSRQKQYLSILHDSEYLSTPFGSVATLFGTMDCNGRFLAYLSHFNLFTPEVMHTFAVSLYYLIYQHLTTII